MHRDDYTLLLKNILAGIEVYRWSADTDQEWERFSDLVAAKQSQRDFEHILFQETSADTLWNLSLKHIDKNLLTPTNPTLRADLLYSIPSEAIAAHKLLTLAHSGQVAELFCQEAHKQGYMTFLAVGINEGHQEDNSSLKHVPDYGGHVFSLIKIEDHLVLVDPFKMVQKKDVQAGMENMPIFQTREGQIPYHQIFNTSASGFKIARLWQNEFQHISSFKDWVHFQRNYQDEQVQPNEFPKILRLQESVLKKPRVQLI